MYPDFLVVRRDGAQLVVYLLDPHRSGLADSVYKAKTLANYAKDHGTSSAGCNSSTPLTVPSGDLTCETRT